MGDFMETIDTIQKTLSKAGFVAWCAVVIGLFIGRVFFRK